MISPEKINELRDRVIERTIKHRKYLHENPELSFKEKKTASYIKQTLDSLNIDYTSNISGFGIMGKIECKHKGKTIALRSDMDALPITENNNIDCKSKNDGVMHACGHDFHMSALLGTAEILSELKDQIAGTYLLIFQPAEEKLPGGAKIMLDDGLFNDIKPDHVIAQHVHPELESGVLGFKSGMYMASADEIYINIKGKGGHAAIPHKFNDTVLAASQVIVSLQQIVSRNSPAKIPTVLSFGKFNANGATNIIPDTVNIEGTFRTYDENWRFNAHERIKEIVENTARAYGCESEIKIVVGYPFLYNDVELTKITKEMAIDIVGENNTKDLDIEPIAEDFAYFSQKYSSSMFRLGVKNKKSDNFGLHNSRFNPNEDALKNSVSALSYFAIQLASK